MRFYLCLLMLAMVGCVHSAAQVPATVGTCFVVTPGYYRVLAVGQYSLLIEDIYGAKRVLPGVTVSSYTVVDCFGVFKR